MLLLLPNLMLSFRNASKLFYISKSSPGLGAFLISLVARSFFRVLEAAIRQSDFARQRLKCLQTLARQGFGIKTYFSLSDLVVVSRYIMINVILNALGKVAHCERIFLNIPRWYIHIISDPAEKVRRSCPIEVTSLPSVEFTHVASRKCF